MITIVCAVLLAAVEIPVARVAEDARAIERVAAASKHDMPNDLLRRMLNEDIELLRGRHSDGTYDYAGYERFESGRVSSSHSVQAHDQTAEIRGSFVYRLLIHVPSRRLVFAHNRKIYVDRVELEYLPLRGNTAKTEKVKVDAWINPGETRTVDFQEIARQATVRVFGHADEKSGYGNLALSLLQGRVFDNPDSPYADAVASAKAILRALDHDDVPSMRAMATRMANDVQPNLAPAAPPATAAEGGGDAAAVYSELLVIQDLLNGTEAERRQAVERLHQLIQKVRPQAH
jgi:hypothetical protein